MDSPQSNSFHHIDTPPDDSNAPDHHSNHLASFLSVLAGFLAMLGWLGLCAYLAWEFLKPFIYLATHSPISSTSLL